MNDMRRSILWVVFAFSLIMLWDKWQIHQGKPATFFPDPQTQTATHTVPPSPAASAAAFPRWGAANKQQVLLEHSQDNSHHILAGRIVAPRDTPRVAALIEAFLLQLGVTPLAADHAADK